MGTSKPYHVAISFAGEDRKYAESLASSLKRRSLTVFYDRYEKASLWGKNLYTHLSDVYLNEAAYCVMLLSKHYATKVWTRHEREAAQARAFQENAEYILPVRLDDTQIPGILPTIGYLQWPPEDAESIADAVVTKVGATHNFSISAPQPVAVAAKTTYCRRCGTVPGNRTECTVGYSHNFVTTNTGVYCTRCGAVPGPRSECTVGFSHNFQTLSTPVYCARCGAVPGQRSECTVGYSHSFQTMNSPVYCVRCGAVPGQRSECTVGYSHNFVTAQTDLA